MNKITIYVRETGHDADGDGLSVDTSYRTRARATMDIPVKFHPDQQYEIDTKGAIEEGDGVDVELAGLQTSTGDIWRLFRERGTGVLWICKNACEYISEVGSTLSDGKSVDGWMYSTAAEQLLKEYVVISQDLSR